MTGEYWVVSAHRKAADDTLAAYCADYGLQQLEADSVRYLLQSSTVIGGESETSLYAPPKTNPAKIIVSRTLPVLLGSDFMLCWLSLLASRTQELLIQGLPAKSGINKARLTAEKLQDCADVFSLSSAEGDFQKLALAGQAAQACSGGGFKAFLQKRFHTAFAYMFDSADDFRLRYKRANDGFIDQGRLKAEFADRQFVYTFHGIVQKSHFIETLAGDCFGGKRLRILDMGGGYGGMAVELALAGHQLTVVELEPAKIEHLGNWFAQTCGVAAGLRYVPGDFEAIKTLDGPFDIISFFGSLLYYPHEKTINLLMECNNKLSGDGLLVIHENPKNLAKPDALDFERQFMPQELDEMVKQAVGQPTYYSIFSHAPLDFAKASQTVMLLAARKNS